MNLRPEIESFDPAIIVGVCLFLGTLCLFGCADKRELALCRDAIPKCSFIIETQAERIEQDKLQIGLCNDLNSALQQLHPPSSKKKAEKQKYLGDPEILEGS